MTLPRRIKALADAVEAASPSTDQLLAHRVVLRQTFKCLPADADVVAVARTVRRAVYGGVRVACTLPELVAASERRPDIDVHLGIEPDPELRDLLAEAEHIIPWSPFE